MTLEEIAKYGNAEATELFKRLTQKFGGGTEYKCAVGAVATAALFHAFRVELAKSKPDALKLMQVLLDDVAYNIRETSGDEVVFDVR